MSSRTPRTTTTRKTDTRTSTASRKSRKAAGSANKLESLVETVQRRSKVFIGIAIAIVVFWGLWGPARDLYCAKRDQEVLSAQLAEVKASSEEIKGNLDRLQSREGIEDEARERGYVGKDEVSVTVTQEGSDKALGKDDKAKGTGKKSASDSGNADNGEKSAAEQAAHPSSWWKKALDVLFGYKPRLVGER